MRAKQEIKKAERQATLTALISSRDILLTSRLSYLRREKRVNNNYFI
jgi:hypothetical protein